MFYRLIALFLIASVCTAQTPAVGSPPTPSTAPQNTTADHDSIIVPAGTMVALKLITAIKSKSTKRGDPVRAIVAFPIAIGSHVAIPAGTYVEGVVDKVKPRPTPGDNASVQLSFTRLLYANGYSVPLVAVNTQAMMLPPESGRAIAVLADARDGAPNLGQSFTAAQTNQQPPPLPRVGPSPALVTGISLGAGAGILALVFAINHHRAGSVDYLVFDSGWQFEMTLQEPLTLDVSQVAAAATMPH